MSTNPQQSRIRTQFLSWKEIVDNAKSVANYVIEFIRDVINDIKPNLIMLKKVLTRNTYKICDTGNKLVKAISHGIKTPIKTLKTLKAVSYKSISAGIYNVAIIWLLECTLVLQLVIGVVDAAIVQIVEPILTVYIAIAFLTFYVLRHVYRHTCKIVKNVKKGKKQKN